VRDQILKKHYDNPTSLDENSWPYPDSNMIDCVACRLGMEVRKGSEHVTKDSGGGMTFISLDLLTPSRTRVAKLAVNFKYLKLFCSA
jgi:hypothetical protein